jgi:hypothetical protein
MTTPDTSGLASSSLMRVASLIHTESFMSCEPMFEICSPVSRASFLASGTASSSSFTPTWPLV